MSKNKRTNRNKGKSDITSSQEIKEFFDESSDNAEEYSDAEEYSAEEYEDEYSDAEEYSDVDDYSADDFDDNEYEDNYSAEDYGDVDNYSADDFNNDEYSDAEEYIADDDYYDKESDYDEENSYDSYKMTKADKRAVDFARLVLIIAIFSAVTVLIVGICLIRYNSNKKKQTIEIQSNYQTITTDWVKNFAEGNFEACDKNVMEQYKILLNDNDKSYDYYIYALKQLGISIRSIEVEKDTEKENTYIIKLTYNPFKKIDKITLNETKVKEYKELETKYVQGSSADSDVKELLDDITTKAYYENCFNIDENISNTEILVLTEENRDGVTYVQGTSKFIDLFLEDSNLKNNIDIYQTQITETISNMINDK